MNMRQNPENGFRTFADVFELSAITDMTVDCILTVAELKRR